MSVTRILVLNAGSSSLKASLLSAAGETLGRSEVAWGADATRAPDRAAGLRAVLEQLQVVAASAPDGTPVGAVGHRVVHGGGTFTAAARVDDAVLGELRDVSRLAPLHNDVALDTIEAARGALPAVPHVACFDTAFHATLPPDAYRYPVPEHWFSAWGVRRYGFHGLSVGWSVRRAGELLARDPAGLGLVVAHLGSGCSVTAVDGGRSVDTSMGFTPLEGLMMGTRSGSIDPGIVTRLIIDGRLSAAEAAEALDHGSGLLGVSGRSADMRELLALESEGHQRAALAVVMFVRRAAAAIAAAATSLGRLDAVAFTGGIGAHSPEVRRRVVARLLGLGLRALPEGPGADSDAVLGDPVSDVAVLRIEAREDLVIAAQVTRLLGRDDASRTPAHGSSAGRRPT